MFWASGPRIRARLPEPAAMFSTLYFVYGLLQIGLFAWALHLWRETREPAVAVLAVPQFFLIWDNMRVAVGPLLGHGELLYWLTWPSFWAHWLSGCWLIIASGAILRLADFAVAKRAVVMGAFCTLTVALMAYDLPYFWTKDIYPVCEYDLIRYSSSVKESTRCFPDQPLVPSSTPLVSLITCLVVIGTGLALWIRRRFPWMFWGGLLMLVSATPPFARWKLDNLGEVFITGGAFWAIWFFTRGRAVTASRAAQRPAPAAPPA
jgi:hypothetical protein